MFWSHPWYQPPDSIGSRPSDLGQPQPLELIPGPRSKQQCDILYVLIITLLKSIGQKLQKKKYKKSKSKRSCQAFLINKARKPLKHVQLFLAKQTAQEAYRSKNEPYRAKSVKDNLFKTLMATWWSAPSPHIQSIPWFYQYL